jgi:HEPN domain-containing protein
MIQEVDKTLIAEGKPIESRPILAASAVSTKFGVPIPLSSEHLTPDLKPYAPLGQAIHAWYKRTYATRLNIDMTVGRTIVDLDGDLYVLVIPRIFGGARFGISRTFIPKTGIQRGPVLCNIIQLVEEMTPAKAALLTDEALAALNIAFERGFSASYTLENTGHELVGFARGDVVIAVNALMERHGRYGASKWASLQAAEKLLKAATALEGGTFPLSHDLARLSSVLNKAGIPFDAPELLAAIQCTPAIRYGDEPCTQDEALAAHQASLELVNRLRDAGAKFQTGLTSGPPASGS